MKYLGRKTVLNTKILFRKVALTQIISCCDFQGINFKNRELAYFLQLTYTIKSLLTKYQNYQWCKKISYLSLTLTTESSRKCRLQNTACSGNIPFLKWRPLNFCHLILSAKICGIQKKCTGCSWVSRSPFGQSFTTQICMVFCKIESKIETAKF